MALCGKYLRDFPNHSPAELLTALQSADVGDKHALLTDLDPSELATNYRLGVAQSLTLHLPAFKNTPAMKLLNIAAYCHPDDIPIKLLATLPPSRVRDFPIDVLARPDSLELLAQHRPDLRALLPASPEDSASDALPSSPGGRTTVARDFSPWNPAPLSAPARRADESATAPRTTPGTPVNTDLLTDLDRVAEHLGDHALALALCGKYLRDFPNRSPAELLTALQSADVGDKDALLTDLDPSELATNYRLGVAQSLTLHLPTFQKTPAMKLLTAAAYCHPDDIPVNLLARVTNLERKDAEKWLRKLADLSIIEYGQTVSIHRLTQQALRSRASAKARAAALSSLLQTLQSVFTKVLNAPDNWPIQDAHAPHAVACLVHALDADPKTVAALANQVALFFQVRARFAAAEPLMRRALEIDEISFGPHHPEVATDLNNLAQLLQATNRLADAEPLMRRCVEIFRDFTRATGHQHPHMQLALENYEGILTALNLPEPEIRARLKDLTP